MIGADRLGEWAGAFGLGKISGIDIDGEATGLVPTSDWKLGTTGERWFLGNTYHFAIGQGDLLLTPLQVNLMTSVIANDGRLCRPRIKEEGDGRTGENTSDGDRVSPPTGGRTSDSSEVKCQDLQLKPETIRLVKEGLKEACLPGGTSGIFVNFAAPVACKTGTAEFGPVKENGYRDTHAWFTAFAPVDDPQIIVTALVEGGGEGSTVAAPIVKKVMEEWFKTGS